MWSITVIILSAIVLGSLLILSLAERAIELKRENQQRDWIRHRVAQDTEYSKMLRGRK